MTHVVVALAAQRLPYGGILQAVYAVTSVGSSVAAGCSSSTFGVAGSVAPDGVNSTETRCSERDEQLRVIGHRAGDTVVAAVESSVDQLPEVAAIQIRA
ncbi:hypothetical protein MGAST_19910 [Mycobacterium gastri 'Wayne']|nr:hypothetical protein MGAST_19910 [Mycobacterium gastri 'Wayne']